MISPLGNGIGTPSLDSIHPSRSPRDWHLIEPPFRYHARLIQFQPTRILKLQESRPRDHGAVVTSKLARDHVKCRIVVHRDRLNHALEMLVCRDSPREQDIALLGMGEGS